MTVDEGIVESFVTIVGGFTKMSIKILYQNDDSLTKIARLFANNEYT